jgi:hypothetical protein
MRQSVRRTSVSYATECVIVPVYVPATAEPGTLMVTVGFHEAELCPTRTDAENAVRDTLRSCALADVACPGVKVPTPEVAVEVPDQYVAWAFPMVSFAVPPPVVKSVDDTDAVHDPSRVPRPSVTETPPSWADTVPAPVEPVPRSFDAGALIESDPAARANVVVVPAACAGSAAANRLTVTAASTRVRLDIGPPRLGSE